MSIIIGSYIGYLIALSKQPIIKTIDFPEKANRKSVEQAEYERHGVGNISYLTTGPTFSQFVYSCEPSVSYSTGPSCLAFAYDGKPGKVEMSLPKYLIEEFPKIDEVYYNGPLLMNGPIPFQITREDDSFVTMRIEIPPKYDVVTVSGSNEGSESPFQRYFFGWGFTMSTILFISITILYAILNKNLVLRK